MARRQRKGQVPEDANLTQASLFGYMKKAYKTYGKYTLEQRAVVDFRDGLKPVQRRVLWAANELGLSGAKAVAKKSAKIVVDTMGRFHPHGDKAIYDTLVGMTHTCSPPVIGVGNFGSQTEPAAAMRYSEAHLSRYADLVFFNKRYLPIIEKVETYDGSETEPLVLPALLPNLLLNGSYGIAVGATSSIPAFEIDGVIELVRRALEGEEATPELCMELLEPKSQEGGLPFLQDKESCDELERFFEKGDGSIYWYPDADINESDRSVLVTGFVPSHAKSLNSSLKKAAADPNVSGFEDETTKDGDSGKRIATAWRVSLKNSIEDEEVEEALYGVTRHFEGKQHLTFTVTERLPPPPDSPEPDVVFSKMNMTAFFKEWVEWRVRLERAAIKRELALASDRLHIVRGLLIAFKNLDDVIEIVRTSDEPAQELMDRFDLSDKQADAILNMRLRQLAKLEEKSLNAEGKALTKEIKRLKASHKEPVPDILDGLDELAEELAKVKEGS